MTGSYAVTSSTSTNYGEYNYQMNGYRKWQAYSISTSFTQISLHSNGNHTHQITGHTGAVGQYESFFILPPF
ncbi:unnamed protein product, partial [Rotaria magnacalcarata]